MVTDGPLKAMHAEAIDMIEDRTRRTVIGFMSDNHIDADLGAEVFALGPNGNSKHVQQADSTA